MVRWVGLVGREAKRWSVRRDHRPLIYLLNRPLVGGRHIITQPTIASALRPPALACDLPHKPAGNRPGEPQATARGMFLFPPAWG